MRYLKGKEKEQAKERLDQCVAYARSSPCLKSQRGVVIYDIDGQLIGKGCNAPPFGETPCGYCLREKIKELKLSPNTEPCRAIHAEQHAMFDAYKHGHSLEGATMYHMKVKKHLAVPSGGPSCTICSKLVVEAGIKEFVLLHKEGIAVYDIYEFHRLSLESVVEKVMKGEK